MLSKELIKKIISHQGEIVIVSSYFEECLESLKIKLKKVKDLEEDTLSVVGIKKSSYNYSRNWQGFLKLNKKKKLEIITWIARHQKIMSRKSKDVFSTDLEIYFIPPGKEGAIYPFDYEGAHQYTTTRISIYDKDWEIEFSENTIAIKWGVKEGGRLANDASRIDSSKKYQSIFNKKVHELYYPAGSEYWLSKNDNDFLLYTNDDVEKEVTKIVGSLEDFIEWENLPKWKKQLKQAHF